MNQRTQFFLLAFTAVTLVAILRLVRSGKLKAKYSLLWITLGVAMLALATLLGFAYEFGRGQEEVWAAGGSSPIARAYTSPNSTAQSIDAMGTELSAPRYSRYSQLPGCLVKCSTWIESACTRR